jgi:general stress protein 26
MSEKEGIVKGLELANRSNIVILANVDMDGYPHARAMIKMENEGLATIWMTTNTSSEKITQLQNENRVCLYFVDFEQWMGLSLVGTIEMLQDSDSRKRCWRDGFEKYYPQGIDDPDYTVLRFTTKWGKYYHGLKKFRFEV